MFDYSNPKSFESIPKWIEQISLNASVNSPTIMVLGNKRDLDQSSRKVQLQEVRELQRRYSSSNLEERENSNGVSEITYADVSARTGFMINESFKSLAQKMLEKGPQLEVTGFKLQ